MNKRDAKDKLFFCFILISFSFIIASQNFGQGKKAVPKEQVPVEERDTGDKPNETVWYFLESIVEGLTLVQQFYT